MREEAENKIERRYLALLPLVALALVLSLLVRPAGPALAAFPGQNGNIVFVSDRDGDSEIRKLSKCLICKTRLTNNAAEDFAPSVSPDGNKIAFVSDRDGNYEIYSMNTDGTGQQRLTNNAAIDANPTWSPDGTRISFQSDRDGAFDQNGNYAAEVYVMDSWMVQTRPVSPTTRRSTEIPPTHPMEPGSPSRATGTATTRSTR